MLKLIPIVVIFILGCNKTGNDLIGVWNNVQTPESVSFRADKSGIFVVKDRPSLAFTWSTVDNTNRVKIDIAFQGRVRTLNGRVEGENFILEGTGQQATYRKVMQQP
jgi:hypothetical protein